MKKDDRVRKRGSSFEGTVDKVASLGIKVTWDLGVEEKTHPLWCTQKELELIT